MLSPNSNQWVGRTLGRLFHTQILSKVLRKTNCSHPMESGGSGVVQV